MKQITISITIELEEINDLEDILYTNSDYGIEIRKDKNEVYTVEKVKENVVIPVSIKDVQKALDGFYKSLAE